MALTNSEKQRAFRTKQKTEGKKEIRGIYATNEEEKLIKEEIKKIFELRKK